MGCAGCEACGSGLFQIHVTVEPQPRGAHPRELPSLLTGICENYATRMHEIINIIPAVEVWTQDTPVIPSGARREWLTTTNVGGTLRDATLVMRQIAKDATLSGLKVVRRKIEVPASKLPEGQGVCYVEAHVKVPLSRPNLDRAIVERMNISVNAEKPGDMLLTFRRKTLAATKRELAAGHIGRFMDDYLESGDIRFEACVFDDNPALDDDWMTYGK